jgi:transposase
LSDLAADEILRPMRSQGSAEELEARRRPAVQRVAEGWLQKEVAAFLGVSERAVNGWVAAHRKLGDAGLAGRPHPGAKPKLTKRREKVVLGWLAKSPRAFGFETDLWTTRRLAELVERRYGVRFNSNYLATWLNARGYAPQKPEVRAVERNEEAIGGWIAQEWPWIKKSEG